MHRSSIDRFRETTTPTSIWNCTVTRNRLRTSHSTQRIIYIFHGNPILPSLSCAHRFIITSLYYCRNLCVENLERNQSLFSSLPFEAEIVNKFRNERIHSGRPSGSNKGKNTMVREREREKEGEVRDRYSNDPLFPAKSLDDVIDNYEMIREA